MSLQQIILLAPSILLALTLHEFAHAYTAHRLGDPTARLLGRLTLNPLKHLDPLGTLMLFLAQFGWAKPVPVDPRYFRSPKRDMLLVALAGPVSNLVLAFISGMMLRLGRAEVFPLDSGGISYVMLYMSLIINLSLAFFNLLPIPPLDGSKILRSLLPNHLLATYLRFESYGPFLLLGLIVLDRFVETPILGALLNPFIDFFKTLFAGSPS